MYKQIYRAGALALACSAALAEGPATSESEIDEITVFGQGRPQQATERPGPVSVLTPEDLVSINAATTEDLVKYEPNLVIRRRYIGDPNGTMGIRGSNMFQTTRSMVYADGIPLHYLLQTQWNGSPRWSLVAADEIGLIEVVYGPFSAEYSGNAMGGVVNIETRIPTERRVHVEGTMFQQAYDHQGFDESLPGGRGFVSYGDRYGDFSVYAAYSHLQNDSQPMEYLFDPVATPDGTETPVEGGVSATDEYGNPVVYFGNGGRQSSTTDQVKTKLGYQFGDWLALLTVGYEERGISTDAVRNYLRDESGMPIWNGSVASGDAAFEIASRDFRENEQERRSLLVGGRLQGRLGEHWWLEGSVSDFAVLEDVTRTSNANPDDPAWTTSGTVSAYDDTGWSTAEVKLRSDRAFGSDALSLVTGASHERYSLRIDNYTSADYVAGELTTPNNASGGETAITAVFAQLGWRPAEAVDLSVGARYETWESRDGFWYDYARDSLQDHEDRKENRVSPKFSVGYRPADAWELRYSLARAYRFPIVEELFQNERRTTGTSIANAKLEPEDGLHHNLTLERGIDGGYLRLNLFTETIDDVIFNQSAIVDNRLITTFLPVDEVRTRGTEFVYNQAGIWSRLDLRLNVAYVDSEILENSANPEIEGKDFPRMPAWRGHLLANWRVSDRWDVGGGIRYASNSYGDLDNADVAQGVFGAHDSYLQANLRTSYALSESIRMSLGIDNLTDEIAFVHHPWPGRTLYLELGLDL
ncbi:MAG: TonB-dependent receptor [Gammaproteobacteria bacterium]|nr:TonB-dependent receptor [Gammaproteobacteria bacterium]MDH4254201.1 TonB-dependent receptor [Gammaproteobacteria bacterium]MDH5309028.1 TonB-dependent receptor [Gammaproteobacteria bacterium]